MVTKVFLSWSGDTSNRIADALCEWLPAVLQFAKPYFTPNDIDKGVKWASEIGKNLSECDIGIICLTRDNLEKPWILFEAGALSKSYDRSHVCIALFGIESGDVKPPLSNFQNTLFSKPDFKKLVETINRAGKENALPDSVVSTVFEKWWPDLEEKIGNILDESKAGHRETIRSERDILEEILDISRSLANKSRSDRNESLDLRIPAGWFKKFIETIDQLVSNETFSPNVIALDGYSELVSLVGYIDERFSVKSQKPDLAKLLASIKIKRDDAEIPF